MKNYILLVLIAVAFGCSTKQVDEKQLIAKADSFIAINQVDSAFNILDRLRFSDNTEIAVESEIKIGQLYELTGEYKYALTLYLGIQNASPIDSLNEKIGLCYYKIHKLDSAIYYFNKNIDKANNFSYCYLGICYEETNKIDTAKIYYKKAIAKNRFKHLSYNNLGGIFFDNEQYDSAMYMYNKSMGIDPYFAAPYCNLATLYMDTYRFQEGLEMVNKAIELDSLNALYVFKKAEFFIFLKQQDSACFYLRKSEELGYPKAKEIVKKSTCN